jgi:hypothetical protein
MTGDQVITKVSSFQITSWDLWGALSIGFVIGWTLAFVNRYVAKSDIKIEYLIGVIGAILGTVVIAFFSNNYGLLGPYGVGVAIGLIVYFILVKVFVKGDGNSWFA